MIIQLEERNNQLEKVLKSPVLHPQHSQRACWVCQDFEQLHVFPCNFEGEKLYKTTGNRYDICVTGARQIIQSNQYLSIRAEKRALKMLS
jgi:hypothetical protein